MVKILQVFVHNEYTGLTVSKGMREEQWSEMKAWEKARFIGSVITHCLEGYETFDEGMLSIEALKMTRPTKSSR